MVTYTLGLFYTTFITVFIRYIKNPQSTVSEGIVNLVIYAILIFSFNMGTSIYIFDGTYTSVLIRKVLISAMYSKVSKLSVKSMTETNSGKLITIVSGDLQVLDKALAFIPTVFVAPYINMVAYGIMWYMVNWQSSLITFVTWVVVLSLQHSTSLLLKKGVQKESGFSDERQKVVNDMVVGARTIKSYGWENHYIEKIKHERSGQSKEMFKNNIIRQLNFAVF